jgi:DNA-binding MarR family transcriptional regulator
MLAESLGMTPMSLTGFLDRLEAAELIARTADPNDRRAKIASLTPQANDVLSQIAQIGERVEAIISDGLTQEQWQTFRQTALTLRQNLAALRGVSCKTEGAK